MTLLVDNQLPLALARYLAANGWECAHVQDVGLDAVEDANSGGILPLIPRTFCHPFHEHVATDSGVILPPPSGSDAR